MSATQPKTGVVVAVFVTAGVVLAACSASVPSIPLGPATAKHTLTGVSNVERVGAVTGTDSPGHTDQWAVNHTDLGSMFEAHGKTWFVFGDTFGERPENQTGGGGSFWRSNVLGYTKDVDPSDGITIDGMILDDTGSAAEVLSSKKIDNDEMTVIPTNGFEANGDMYLHYMSVRHWGEPGEWEANFAGLATSTDSGQTWTKLDSPTWSGTSNFVQVSVTKVAGELYFWGISHGRFGGVQLMNVAEQDVGKHSAYEYFAGVGSDGKSQWSSSESDAQTILDDTVGELSVVWNDYLGSWLMTYLKEGSGIVIRQSASPWGPWSEAIDLVTAQQVPGLYAPFMNPKFVTDGGRTIYFTLSVWDPYNVFWYRADLTTESGTETH